jgi:threonine/homoserine/homoserine lactone efflux protein
MIVLVGIGLIKVFDAFPVAYTILKVLSVLYLLYLAWKIANAAPPSEAAETGTPMTFLQACAFQWVNPKAWAMALTAISVYTPTQGVAAILLTATIFGVINLPACSTWMFIGQQMRRFLTNPARLRAFNIVMALLLVASLYPMLA